MAHKSWDDRTPIEINIYKDKITVYNIEGPVPPISNEDLKNERVICRSYRNRRVGDFLKELHLTEGRNTGFPKIYREMRNNGSPLPIFETDDRNIHFIATLPIHPAFIDAAPQSAPQNEPQKLTLRQQQIISLINQNNHLSRQEMAHKLGISYSTIKRELSAMSHIVKYVGASKGGYWKILASY